MPIRRADERDIPVILEQLTHLPIPPYQEDVGRLLTLPNEHIWVNDETNQTVRISVMEERQEAVVVWLFPRAAWMNDNLLELARLLAAALLDVSSKWPSTWRVSATFMGGKNAKGVDDGGKELCTTWRDRVFRISNARRASIRDRGDGVWEISWTIAEAAAKAAGG
jgi:hypothetical protein